MEKVLLAGALASSMLCGCIASMNEAAPAATAVAAPATAAPSVASSSAASSSAAGAPPHYRCDNGMEFTVRFADDSAVVDAGPRGGREELPRDAGGATPQQTVYSNTRMRAEFGLGVSGREALLRYAQPPLLAHCVRE